jgi:hypothetical protein
MPYSIKSDHPDCSGFAVVKTATNEVMGCHKTKAQAQDQLTAINIAEYGNRSELESAEKEEIKSRLEIAYEIINKLQKKI